MEQTINKKSIIESLAYAYYKDDLFQIAEQTDILLRNGCTAKDVDRQIEEEFNRRFRNNPYRARRYKKNYK